MTHVSKKRDVNRMWSFLSGVFLFPLRRVEHRHFLDNSREGVGSSLHYGGRPSISYADVTFEGKIITAYFFFRSCLTSYLHSFGVNGYTTPRSVERTAIWLVTAGIFSAFPLVLTHYGVSGRSCCTCTGSHFAIAPAGTAATSAFSGRKELWLPRNPVRVAPKWSSSSQLSYGSQVVTMSVATARWIPLHPLPPSFWWSSLPRPHSRGFSFWSVGSAFSGFSGPRRLTLAYAVGDFVLVEPYGVYASTTTATTGSLRWIPEGGLR